MERGWVCRHEFYVYVTEQKETLHENVKRKCVFIGLHVVL